jgi:hypothetical protein
MYLLVADDGLHDFDKTPTSSTTTAGRGPGNSRWARRMGNRCSLFSNAGLTHGPHTRSFI